MKKQIIKLEQDIVKMKEKLISIKILARDLQKELKWKYVDVDYIFDYPLISQLSKATKFEIKLIYRYGSWIVELKDRDGITTYYAHNKDDDIMKEVKLFEN